MSDAVRRAGPAAEADIAGSSTSQATAALDGDKRALLEDIRARNAEIARLGRSVEELNQTFQDISILVEAQQGLVNEVEYNLEEVALDTAQGTGELVKTQNYQRKKRRRQIWCLVILVVIIALVILGVVLAVTRR